MKETILSLVREYVDDVPDDTSVNLIEAGQLDSLAMLNIMSSLESEFEIEIDGEDISKRNFASIDSMAALVKKYVK